MRIAISGAQNTGKTTLVKAILEKWPMYKTPSKSYRDVIIEKGLTHSSKTTVETQNAILDFMIESHSSYTSINDNILFDRCTIDNIVYSMWANAAGIDGFPNEYISEVLKKHKEVMRKLDIVFVLRHDKERPIEDDGIRDINPEYVKDIDLIFGAICDQYYNNPDGDVFFPKNDMPAIIELPHSHTERMSLIGDYIDQYGDLVDTSESVLSPENIQKVESLIKQQYIAKEQEDKDKELFKKFKQ